MQATDYPGSVLFTTRPLPLPPFLPILPLAVLENRTENGCPAQDDSDEGRAALTFVFNIVPVGTKVAGDEHKGNMRPPAP